MRLTSLLTIIIIVGLVIPARVAAQPATASHIVLYAHDSGGFHVLSASTQWNGERIANISLGITFALQPQLGSTLQIDGAIISTVYLQSDRAMQGTLDFNMSERTKSGIVTPVPGANIATPITLATRTLAYGVGMGPVRYLFQNASSILVNIRVQPITPGTPFLLWDDPVVPTAAIVPAISPTSTNLSVTSNVRNYGRILEVPAPQGLVNATLVADVADAFGTYRIADASASLTAPNGTVKTLALHKSVLSAYHTQYSSSLNMSIGYWQISFVIVYSSGDSYGVTAYRWVAPFYPVQFYVVDNDTENGISNAIVTVTFLNETQWVAPTNSSGIASMTLPSTDVIGSLNASVRWNSLEMAPSPISVPGPTTVRFRIHLSVVTLRFTIDGLPLTASNVTVFNAQEEAFSGVTGLVGNFSFHALPGNYTVVVRYLFSEFTTSVNVVGTRDVQATVSVPANPLHILGAGIIIFLAAATTTIVTLRRRVTYQHGFDFFDSLTAGGLPQTCFVVIAGNSGSGKTVLLETLAGDHLSEGKGVYITNVEYPSKVREDMSRLGIAQSQSNLMFIDAYSAIAGTPSVEEYSLSSQTDLTSLGLLMSKCLEMTGRRTDVFLDSLNPMLAALRGEYLLNFLQSVAAKIKANEGRFYVTVGLGIEKSDMTKLEEASDCVIETQLQETRGGQRRRLRVKKLRGKSYSDKWVRFRVETGKGIVFLTREKAIANRKMNQE
jgi:KaiC/GvpD/RAD55 family RecA-like ATPase